MYYIPKCLNSATFLTSKDNQSLVDHVKKKYSGKKYETKLRLELFSIWLSFKTGHVLPVIDCELRHEENFGPLLLSSWLTYCVKNAVNKAKYN